MESTRRFKRPRNVFRALRGQAHGNTAPAIDAATQETPHETYPHLSLVTEAGARTEPTLGADGGAGLPPNTEPERDGEPPKGSGRGKLILFGILLVVVAAGSSY